MNNENDIHNPSNEEKNDAPAYLVPQTVELKVEPPATTGKKIFFLEINQILAFLLS